MRANSVPNFDRAVKPLEAVQFGQLEFSDLTVAKQESVICLLELVVSQL